MTGEPFRLEVLNPRGEPPAVAPIAPAPPVAGWRGARLGVLNNTRSGGEQLLPYLVAGLRRLLPQAEVRVFNVAFGLPEADKAPLLAEVAAASDAVVALTGEGGAPTARTARDAAAVEALGRPVAFIVVRGFAGSARFNAAAVGLGALRVVELPGGTVPPPADIERLGLAESVPAATVAALEAPAPASPTPAGNGAPTLAFSGADPVEAVAAMEQHFLARRWSDGLPLVPPRREAVAAMVAATDLPPDRLVARLEPLGGAATVEKIAVNAVMAGCRPHYLPLLLAAVEALADPRFDLNGVACTAGPAAPLLVVSGPALIEGLNLNDGFGALGPGWRANATIGRALRLMMINLGGCWPGEADLKAFGSPFMQGAVVAEHEAAYPPGWEPLRVAEGFDREQPTVSVLAASTWQVDLVPPERASLRTIQERVGHQARAKYDRLAPNWGADNLLLLSPSAFDPLRREGVSRRALQEAVCEVARLSAREFFEHKPPRAETGGNPLPAEMVARAHAAADAPMPLLKGPESLKVVAAGAHGPAMLAYVSTWGWGGSYFVTKPVRLPPEWGRMAAAEAGWRTPAAGPANR